MRGRLDRLYEATGRAEESGELDAGLQEAILEGIGKAIGRILELEKAGGTGAREPYRQALEKTDKLLRFILRVQEAKVEELQEKLDETADVERFLASAEWKRPQHLIALARYWLAWNDYYRSIALPSKDPLRARLLGEAIGGFSLTLLDVEDKGILARGRFGRALCFKEMGREDRALQDLEALTDHVGPEDPLFAWGLYREALGLLHGLRRVDPSYTRTLYRLVARHPDAFEGMTAAELGPVGTLALADRRFEEGAYEEAVGRYRSVRPDSADPYLRGRMEDIHFRSAYALCRLERWGEALEALRGLGGICEARGRWREALALWRRYADGAEPGSPGWFDARYRIARAHARLGEPEAACDVLTMLRVLHPEIEGASLRARIRELEGEVCRGGRPGAAPSR